MNAESLWSALRCGVVGLCLGVGLVPIGAARCADEEPFDTEGPLSGQAGRAPRAQLQALVQRALQRSQQIGAARLLSDAAQGDLEEARAASQVQASLSGTLGPEASRQAGGTASTALQLRSAVSVSQTLYDGGRTQRQNEWRRLLADAARYSERSLQDQVALSAITLALERSRWRQQGQVYGQYSRKMACLVDALQSIVETDRGRASELLQARKSQQQAELSLAEARAQERQVAVQLVRLLGPEPPELDSLAGLLLAVPALPTLVADVPLSPDIAQLRAQAAAASQYAQLVRAGNKPQLSWVLSGGQLAGNGGNTGGARSTSASVGLALNIPLLNPGNAPASDAAQRRADAAALQLEDALESRNARLAEVHDQAEAALDRARRLSRVLRDSDLVRDFTLQQWQQLGRRSLFDVMGAESEHYSLRVAFVNALHDGQQMNAMLWSLGRGVNEWLR